MANIEVLNQRSERRQVYAPSLRDQIQKVQRHAIIMGSLFEHLAENACCEPADAAAADAGIQTAKETFRVTYALLTFLPDVIAALPALDSEDAEKAVAAMGGRRGDSLPDAVMRAAWAEAMSEAVRS